jgi:hypothetical protein
MRTKLIAFIIVLGLGMVGAFGEFLQRNDAATAKTDRGHHH